MDKNKKATYCFITYRDGSRIKTPVNKILMDASNASLTNGFEGNEEERKHGKVTMVEMYNEKDELIFEKEI